MTKEKIIGICETVGGSILICIVLTLFWVIWDLSRLPLQVLGTELVIALLCYIIQASQEDDGKEG